MSEKKGKSPYSKYSKAPYDYSAMYNKYPNLRKRPAVSSFVLIPLAQQRTGGQHVR